MKATIVIFFACAVAAMSCSAKGRTSDPRGAAGASGAAGAGGAAGSAGVAGAPVDAGGDAWCTGLHDNNPCTIDECDPNTGHVSHIPLPMDDSDACTVDACNPATAEITHTPLPAIDDSNACTIDSCDPLTGIIKHEEGSYWKCGSAEPPCPPGFYIKEKLNSCTNCGCPTISDYDLCAPIGC